MAVSAKSKLSAAAKMAVEFYEADTKGCARFLTDTMKRAIAAKAVMDVMVARYEVESERETPTSPNVYVDLMWEVEKFVGLRD